ncbi:hypothetical protein KAR34_10235, partial [bacterium]|nr:hypothetical protein [bacterium]
MISHSKILIISFWHLPLAKAWTRLVGLLIAITFLWPSLLWSFEVQTYLLNSETIRFSGRPIEIPKKIGKITQSFQGENKLVIYIEDLHCNYEVQDNIARIIDYLANHHNLRVVGIEGASHTVNVSKLSTFPVESVKKEVGRYFMRQGKISGAEFYAATGRRPIVLEGIENAAYYQAGRECVMTFLNDESQGYVCDIRERLEILKAKIYNSKLTALDKKKTAFRDGRLSLFHYCRYLLKTASQAGFFLDVDEYRHLKKYAVGQSEVFAREIDSDALYLQIEKLDLKLREGYYTQADQQSLDQLLHCLDIMEKMLNISVCNEEFAEYCAKPYWFKINTFQTFIQKHDLAGELFIEPEIYALEKYLKKVENFYANADLRSQYFVRNLLTRMDQRKTNIAVMVSGGYHTQHVIDLLRGQNVSYVSLKPTLTRVDIINPYFTLLREKRTPLEKLLAQNQNIINLPPGHLDPDFRNQTDVSLKACLGLELMDLSLQQFKHRFGQTISRYTANTKRFVADLDKVVKGRKTLIIPFKGVPLVAAFYPKQKQALLPPNSLGRMTFKHTEMAFYRQKAEPGDKTASVEQLAASLRKLERKGEVVAILQSWLLKWLVIAGLMMAFSGAGLKRRLSKSSLDFPALTAKLKPVFFRANGAVKPAFHLAMAGIISLGIVGMMVWGNLAIVPGLLMMGMLFLLAIGINYISRFKAVLIDQLLIPEIRQAAGYFNPVLAAYYYLRQILLSFSQPGWQRIPELAGVDEAGQVIRAKQNIFTALSMISSKGKGNRGAKKNREKASDPIKYNKIYDGDKIRSWLEELDSMHKMLGFRLGNENLPELHLLGDMDENMAWQFSWHNLHITCFKSEFDYKSDRQTYIFSITNIETRDSTGIIGHGTINWGPENPELVDFSFAMYPKLEQYKNFSGKGYEEKILYMIMHMATSQKLFKTSEIKSLLFLKSILDEYDAHIDEITELLSKIGYKETGEGYLYDLPVSGIPEFSVFKHAIVPTESTLEKSGIEVRILKHQYQKAMKIIGDMKGAISNNNRIIFQDGKRPFGFYRNLAKIIIKQFSYKNIELTAFEIKAPRNEEYFLSLKNKTGDNIGHAFIFRENDTSDTVQIRFMIYEDYQDGRDSNVFFNMLVKLMTVPGLLYERTRIGIIRFIKKPTDRKADWKKIRGFMERWGAKETDDGHMEVTLEELKAPEAWPREMNVENSLLEKGISGKSEEKLFTDERITLEISPKLAERGLFLTGEKESRYGTYSFVYPARDKNNDLVAIRINRKNKKLFNEEMREYLEKLDGDTHDNVVLPQQVDEFQTKEGEEIEYQIMPWLETKQSIRMWFLEKEKNIQGRREIKELLPEIFFQVMSAVGFLHFHGLAHADLRSECDNILLSRKHIYVIDPLLNALSQEYQITWEILRRTDVIDIRELFKKIVSSADLSDDIFQAMLPAINDLKNMIPGDQDNYEEFKENIAATAQKLERLIQAEDLSLKIPKMSLLPEPVVLGFFNLWLKEKWARRATLIYLTIIGPAIETAILATAILTWGINIFVTAIGFSAAHFIVAWLVRAKDHGGLIKALTPDFIRASVKDFVIRLGLGYLFIAPFLAFDRVIAGLLSFRMHSAYNIGAVLYNWLILTLLLNLLEKIPNIKISFDHLYAWLRAPLAAQGKASIGKQLNAAFVGADGRVKPAWNFIIAGSLILGIGAMILWGGVLPALGISAMVIIIVFAVVLSYYHELANYGKNILASRGLQMQWPIRILIAQTTTGESSVSGIDLQSPMVKTADSSREAQRGGKEDDSSRINPALFDNQKIRQVIKRLEDPEQRKKLRSVIKNLLEFGQRPEAEARYNFKEIDAWPDKKLIAKINYILKKQGPECGKVTGPVDELIARETSGKDNFYQAFINGVAEFLNESIYGMYMQMEGVIGEAEIARTRFSYMLLRAAEILSRQDQIKSLLALKTKITNCEFKKTAHIFDLHSKPEVLADVIRRVRHREIKQVIFHGDAFDGVLGSSSRVFQHMKELKILLGDDFIMVLGNHEVMMIQALLLNDINKLLDWVGYGGFLFLKEFLIPENEIALIWDAYCKKIGEKRGGKPVPQNELNQLIMLRDEKTFKQVRGIAQWMLANSRIYQGDERSSLNDHAGLNLNNDASLALPWEEVELAQQALSKIQQTMSRDEPLSEESKIGLAEIFENMHDFFWVTDKDWVDKLSTPDGEKADTDKSRGLLNNLGYQTIKYGHVGHLKMKVLDARIFGGDVLEEKNLIIHDHEGIKKVYPNTRKKDELLLSNEEFVKRIDEQIAQLRESDGSRSVRFTLPLWSALASAIIYLYFYIFSAGANKLSWTQAQEKQQKLVSEYPRITQCIIVGLVPFLELLFLPKIALWLSGYFSILVAIPAASVFIALLHGWPRMARASPETLKWYEQTKKQFKYRLFFSALINTAAIVLSPFFISLLQSFNLPTVDSIFLTYTLAYLGHAVYNLVVDSEYSLSLTRHRPTGPPESVTAKAKQKPKKKLNKSTIFSRQLTLALKKIGVPISVARNISSSLAGARAKSLDFLVQEGVLTIEERKALAVKKFSKINKAALARKLLQIIKSYEQSNVPPALIHRLWETSPLPLATIERWLRKYRLKRDYTLVLESLSYEDPEAWIRKVRNEQVPHGRLNRQKHLYMYDSSTRPLLDEQERMDLIKELESRLQVVEILSRLHGKRKIRFSLLSQTKPGEVVIGVKGLASLPLKPGQKIILKKNNCSFEIVSLDIPGNSITIRELGKMGEEMPPKGEFIADESLTLRLEYSILEKIITKLKESRGRTTGRLAYDRLFGLASLTPNDFKPIDFINPLIPFSMLDDYESQGDESEEMAVKLSMSPTEKLLIEGSTGNGKTTVGEEDLWQMVKQGDIIIYVCQMNHPVDNLVSKVMHDLPVLRLGNDPSRFKYNTQLVWPGNRETGLNSGVVDDFIRKYHKNGSKGFIIAATDTGLLLDWMHRSKLHFMLRDGADVFIMDEATRERVSGALVPLQMLKESGKMIFIGDVRQLPVHELSDQEKKALSKAGIKKEALKNYNLSIFEWLLRKKHGNRVMLSTNWRSIPLLGLLTSLLFYEGDVQLKGWEDFEPDTFVLEDIYDPEKPREYYEKSSGKSFFNLRSAAKVLELVRHYSNRGIALDEITIITPYQEQVDLIKNLLFAALPKAKKLPIVTTIDSYQGGENRVVIFDAVRSNKKRIIGFVKDLRRTNVGLSRAIENMAIVWDSRTLLGKPTARDTQEDRIARSVFQALRNFYLEEVYTFFPDYRLAATWPQLSPKNGSLAEKIESSRKKVRLSGKGFVIPKKEKPRGKVKKPILIIGLLPAAALVALDVLFYLAGMKFGFAFGVGLSMLVLPYVAYRLPIMRGYF